uniref:Mitochondrial import inner membrane translocase subunit n=1 Tax=Karlodinium veneficum TaxID=407301 RepID=F2WQ72_KARVE|nr:mitochondrial Tim10/DDP family zinc finger-like protein 2 [Karlodinium veneficum]
MEQSDIERTQGLLQMQTLIQGQKVTMKILGLCFDRCVDVPDTQLQFKEQQCLWQCTQRLFETESFLVKRLQAAQKQKMG